ncbi:MAG: hypothetical protein ABW318_17020 [Vicinamibacterales bacterium]
MDPLPVDATFVAEGLAADRVANRETVDGLYAGLPRPGYAIPMAWRCAVTACNNVVNDVPRFSSADHGSWFKALISVIRAVMDRSGQDDFKGPYFDSSVEEDEALSTCLRAEYDLIAYLNLETCLREGSWRLGYASDDDAFRLTLRPCERRSALTLLNGKLQFLALSPGVQEMAAKGSSPREIVPMIVETGMTEVEFLRDAVPKAWKRLASHLGFTIDEGLRFQAFITALMETGGLWFRTEGLCRTFSKFLHDEGFPSVSSDRQKSLVTFFSATPEEIESWGIAVPFVRVGDWLAYWPFAHHVLPPSLTFLTLLMRKYPDQWNNTVGSELADVATRVRSGLFHADLLFTTVKAKKGIGDIDLGIYDRQSRTLMLCEVKTVFDRFRTGYQMANFVDQRVNFAKAERQLASAAEAIASGTWPLSDLFGRTMAGTPDRILPVVLTWYDQHDPWAGLDRTNMASCSFRVFRYLFDRAAGNLERLHEAIRQLSRVYCEAAWQTWPLTVRDQGLVLKRQVQSDLLPPAEMLNAMPLSELVRKELETLPKLPLDWVAQLPAMQLKPSDFYFYEFDEP